MNATCQPEKKENSQVNSVGFDLTPGVERAPRATSLPIGEMVQHAKICGNLGVQAMSREAAGVN